MHRRKFLTAAALAASPLPGAQPVRFGVDLFSIRSQGWTPFQYLDYCAKWKAKVVHFSEIRFIGNLEEAHLRQVRAHAEKLGSRSKSACGRSAPRPRRSTRRKARRRSSSLA